MEEYDVDLNEKIERIIRQENIKFETIIKDTLESLKELKGFNVLYEIEEDEEDYQQFLDDLFKNVRDKRYVRQEIPGHIGLYYIEDRYGL
jgi:hypothetical protein